MRTYRCNASVRLQAMLRRELTDDAYLRLYEEVDVDELQATIEANRDHLSAWLPWAAAQEREGTLAFIRASRRQLADNDGLQTAIVEHGAIVGGIGVHGIDWGNGSTTIGYWLARDAQGRGLATLAAAAYVEQALGPWGLHRVEIRAAVDNHRSRAIPQRLGFREEGIKRGAERVGDRWLDHVVYAKLAGD